MYNIRYYAIGHSYLRHGPFQGWQTDGFWGMAASEPSKDYFHKFGEMLKTELGSKIEAIAENHAEYERCCVLGATREDYINSKGYNRMREVISEFKPNLISVFVGGGNTIAKDAESLTLFYDVLFEMIKENKREEAVVVCIGTNAAFEYCKVACEKYGFIAADCTFIHAVQGAENPYYAFKDYPEYDAEAAAGAVEFRTHPNDRGHEAIAKTMMNCVKAAITKSIPKGEFTEAYTYEKYLQPEKIEKFNIKTTPEFLVRFGGFNIRQDKDCVSFSSAPGTGALISAGGIHIKGENKKFYIKMSVDCSDYPHDLELVLSSGSGEHKYVTVIPDEEMRTYEFDIADISEMITAMKIKPSVTECLLSVKELGFIK